MRAIALFVALTSPALAADGAPLTGTLCMADCQLRAPIQAVVMPSAHVLVGAVSVDEHRTFDATFTRVNADRWRLELTDDSATGTATCAVEDGKATCRGEWERDGQRADFTLDLDSVGAWFGVELSSL